MAPKFRPTDPRHHDLTCAVRGDRISFGTIGTRPRLNFLSVRRKQVNQLHTYLESGTYVGLDQYLILQRKIDGAIAAKLGLTALAPMGALVGLIIGYLVFA